jgi:hypothetical protein
VRLITDPKLFLTIIQTGTLSADAGARINERERRERTFAAIPFTVAPTTAPTGPIACPQGSIEGRDFVSQSVCDGAPIGEEGVLHWSTLWNLMTAQLQMPPHCS